MKQTKDFFSFLIEPNNTTKTHGNDINTRHGAQVKSHRGENSNRF